MKTLKIFLVITGCTLIINIVTAQDVHFSQYNNSPLVINPSNAGSINTDYRVNLNYKNQWSSIHQAYATYCFSYDMGLLKKEIHSGYPAIGINIMQDIAGETRLANTNASLSFVYHVPIKNTQYLSGAIQAGILQNSIDESKLKWDNQYIGEAGFDPNLPSGENSFFENVIAGDFSAGLSWNYNSKISYLNANDARSITLGIAGFHLNRPFITFYNNHEIYNRLYPRFVFSGNSYFGIKNTNLGIMPSALLMYQGVQHEIIAGCLVKYRIKEPSHYTYYINTTSVAIGGSYRFKDAIILESQFEFSGFTLGFSYDINISRLRVATYGRGGMELSLIYKAYKKRSASKY